jgi:hypothetical protein
MFRGNPLRANKPLIWAVAAGLLMVVLAFVIPGLREVLGIVPLHIGDWLLVSGVALGLLAVVEVGKAIVNRPRRAMSLEVSHHSHKPSGGK